MNTLLNPISEAPAPLNSRNANSVGGSPTKNSRLHISRNHHPCTQQ